MSLRFNSEQLLTFALDRVTAGTLPDRLFDQLNVIHLVQGDRPDGRPTRIRPR